MLMDHISIRSGRNYSMRGLQLHHSNYPLYLWLDEIVDATNYLDMAKRIPCITRSMKRQCMYAVCYLAISKF